jgi:hypothetical protein
LVHGFDASGDQIDIQMLGLVDDRIKLTLDFGVRGDLLDKVAIELQAVDRQYLERSIANAASLVIQGDADPPIL